MTERDKTKIGGKINDRLKKITFRGCGSNFGGSEKNLSGREEILAHF